MQKLSKTIGYKGTQTLYYAGREVDKWVGCPLNTLITINFSHTAVAPKEAAVIKAEHASFAPILKEGNLSDNNLNPGTINISA